MMNDEAEFYNAQAKDKKIEALQNRVWELESEAQTLSYLLSEIDWHRQNNPNQSAKALAEELWWESSK